jgi:hypothetical protein
MPYAQGTRVGGGPDTIVGWDDRMAKSIAAWDEAIEHHWGEGRTGGGRARPRWRATAAVVGHVGARFG